MCVHGTDCQLTPSKTCARDDCAGPCNDLEEHTHTDVCNGTTCAGTWATCADTDGDGTPAICGSNATCSNTAVGYQCTCDAGFKTIGPQALNAAAQCEECSWEIPVTAAYSEALLPPGSVIVHFGTIVRQWSRLTATITADSATVDVNISSPSEGDVTSTYAELGLHNATDTLRVFSSHASPLQPANAKACVSADAQQGWLANGSATIFPDSTSLQYSPKPPEWASRYPDVPPPVTADLCEMAVGLCKYWDFATDGTGDWTVAPHSDQVARHRPSL